MEDGSIELKTYWHMFLRWWWLFILAAAVAASAAYYVGTPTTPIIFESRVQIVVESQGTPGIPTAADFTESAFLAQNFVDLIKRRPILELVAQRLPVRYSPGTVGNKINVTSRRNIIQITATDRDPVLAAIIANTTAETFIGAQMDRQLSQLAQFQNVLKQYGIEQDRDIVARQAATLGILSIIEPAIPSSSPPNGSENMRSVLIAAVVGILLTGLGVVFIEYLDNRIKSLGALKAVTGLTPMGSIPRYKVGDGKGYNVFDDDHRLGYVVESYNALRVNIDFAIPDKTKLKTILVTSSLMREGKTTTAVNLAISLAKENKSVILVDSDLRSSSLHRLFELGDHKGLTHFITGDATLEEALAVTHIEGLCIIPSGSQPPDPTIVLRSEKFSDAVKQLKMNADILIFDSSPVLAVTDPLVLASQVDVVLLVVDAGHTSREAVVQAVDRLNQVNPSPAFMSAVLNNANIKGGGEHFEKHFRKYVKNSRRQRRIFGKYRLLPVFFGLVTTIALILGLIIFIVVGPLDFSTLG